MREVYAVVAKLTLHSPLSFFTPFTTTSADTFLLPPPTSLVGALAYPYFRARGYHPELIGGSSPAVELIKPPRRVLYAAAAPVLTYSRFRTVERVYQHIYLRREYQRNIGMAYTVAARGCVLTNQLYAFYLVTDPELAEYAYGIVRIGRKEGLTSVEEVVCEELSKIAQDESSCKTRFYFPKAIALDYANAVIERMPRLDPLNFEKRISDPRMIPYEDYVAPSPFALEPVSVTLNERGLLLFVTMSNESLYIPVPREVLEGEQ